MKYTPADMKQEMLRLAHVLLEQTEQGSIKWSATDEDNQFLFSSAKSAMLIRGEFGNYDDEHEGDFTLELLNRGGSVAAHIEIEWGIADSPEYAPDYELLKQLWLTVRNRALEVDVTLEDMRQALGVETDG